MIDLTFENVSKRYVVRREDSADLTVHPWVRKVRALRARKEEFWALRDVSFDVKHGETLGIIGHNGAGKSTILKLLSGITTPTSGRMVINGRLSALIEVGSGFHPELTGRENIFLNGAILGMTRQEIAAKLHSIVEFAGVRQFLDVPVKRFSSGMYVRLGFSIAAHLDPDILLLDEVLAVGDAAFQEKCLHRISELKRAGTTIVFISHDLGAVERVCDRVILLRSGQVIHDGVPHEVIAEYQARADAPTINAAPSALANGQAEIATVTFHDERGHRQTAFPTGEPMWTRLAFELREPVVDVVFEVLLYAPGAAAPACQLTTASSDERIDLPAGTGTLTFACAALGLQPGLYYADAAIRHRGAAEALHWQYQAAVLRVPAGKSAHGLFYQDQSWQLSVNPRQSIEETGRATHISSAVPQQPSWKMHTLLAQTQDPPR